jgi:hypothetical protein
MRGGQTLEGENTPPGLATQLLRQLPRANARDQRLATKGAPSSPGLIARPLDGLVRDCVLKQAGTIA